jgi:hypothetical protein
MAVTTRRSSVLAANPMTRTTRTSSMAAYRRVATSALATNVDTDIAKKPSSAKQNANYDNKEPYRRRSKRAKRTSSDSAPPGLPPLRRKHIRIGKNYQASIPPRDFAYSHSESSEDHGDILCDPSLIPIIQVRACSLISHLAVDARNQYKILQRTGLEYILREMANHEEDYDIQTTALEALCFLFSNNEDILSIVKDDVVVFIDRALGNFKGDEKVAIHKKAYDVLSRTLPSRHPQNGNDVLST